MPGTSRLPAGVLPASARTQLTAFSALVDFVDNDQGTVKQESFLSSSPRRRFGDRGTFQTVKLAAPVHNRSADVSVCDLLKLCL